MQVGITIRVGLSTVHLKLGGKLHLQIVISQLGY